MDQDFIKVKMGFRKPMERLSHTLLSYNDFLSISHYLIQFLKVGKF